MHCHLRARFFPLSLGIYFITSITAYHNMSQSAPSHSPILRIRAVQLRDIPAIASLLILALDQDSLFDFNFPHRTQYPEDCYNAWRSMIMSWLYEPWTVFLCAEILEGDWSLAGFARWEVPSELRACDEATHERWRKMMIQNGWWQWLLRVVLMIHRQLWTCFSYFAPPLQSRHVNWEHIHAFRIAVAATDKRFWDHQTGLYPSNFRITALATHPDYRRRGVGTGLIEWGLQWADACSCQGSLSNQQEESGRAGQIVVGVEATHEGRSLYRRLGFKDIGTEEIRDEQGDVIVRNWVMIRGVGVREDKKIVCVHECLQVQSSK